MGSLDERDMSDEVISRRQTACMREEFRTVAWMGEICRTTCMREKMLCDKSHAHRQRGCARTCCATNLAHTGRMHERDNVDRQSSRKQAAFMREKLLADKVRAYRQLACANFAGQHNLAQACCLYARTLSADIISRLHAACLCEKMSADRSSAYRQLACARLSDNVYNLADKRHGHVFT